MTLITRSECLKQPDTHFVPSGFTQPVSNKAYGYCLCPVGKEFDYDKTKKCFTPKFESTRGSWPVPINNFEADPECKSGFDEVVVDGQPVCIAKSCPNGRSPTIVNGIPTCIDKSSIVYGYLLTNPCNRITSPTVTLPSVDEVETETYFTKRCPLARRQPPISDEIVNSYKINSPLVPNSPTPKPITQDKTPKLTPQQLAKLENARIQRERIISAIGIVILLLLWFAVIYMWIGR